MLTPRCATAKSGLAAPEPCCRHSDSPRHHSTPVRASARSRFASHEGQPRSVQVPAERRRRGNLDRCSSERVQSGLLCAARGPHCTAVITRLSCPARVPQHAAGRASQICAIESDHVISGCLWPYTTFQQVLKHVESVQNRSAAGAAVSQRAVGRAPTGDALAKEPATINAIVLTHLNPDIVETLGAVLSVIKRPADGLTLIVSNPGKQVRQSRSALPRCIASVLRMLRALSDKTCAREDAGAQLGSRTECTCATIRPSVRARKR